jgi:hypothetical protein
MRRAVIHIGPHKTGSTALQSVGEASASALSALGVLYPPGHWHPQLASRFVENPRAFVFNVHAGRQDDSIIAAEDAAFIARLEDTIVEHNPRMVILSYEGFFGLDRTALSRIRAYLASLCDRTDVVFYYRQPFSFARSEISQRARMGLPTYELRADNLPVLRYADSIPPYLDVFGRSHVHLRSFAEAIAHGGIPNDFFCSFLDLPRSALVGEDSGGVGRNESITEEARQVADHLRAFGSPAFPGNNFFRRYNRALSRFKGGPIRIGSELAHAIERDAARHHLFLREVFGLEELADEAEETKRPNDVRVLDPTFAQSLAELVHDYVQREEGSDS